LEDYLVASSQQRFLFGAQVGEFQCYDRRALASLKAAAAAAGHPEWGYAGPADAGSYNSTPEVHSLQGFPAAATQQLAQVLTALWLFHMPPDHRGCFVDTSQAQCVQAQEAPFFRSWGGSWDTEYGRFFLGWYSGELLAHGERLMVVAAAIFKRNWPVRQVCYQPYNSVYGFGARLR
jgi:beta-amylase